MVAGRDIIRMAPEPAQPAPPPEPRAGIAEPIAHFVGRDDELAELRQHFTASRRVVIHGLGGIGKTQLAIRYSNQHSLLYLDGQFWLRADQVITLVSDLASLAWRLDLPERERPEQELQIEAVLRWLRQHEHWLLVVDNLDPSMAEAMRYWLPSDLPGHLLITSRSARGPVRVGLEPLSVEIATKFLLERTGQYNATAARTIAEALGGLPLALEQAAAYLTENHWRTLAEYADLLRSRMADLLRQGKPEDYPLPVATTWKLSFQRIEEEQPAAADLLRLCGFMAPDDIPISLLESGAYKLPADLRGALSDPIRFDKAIGALRDYSLLERQHDGLRLHRLVQWVVRESLEADQHKFWLGAAIDVLRAAFPQHDVDDPQHWPVSVRLLPHVQRIADLAGGQMVKEQQISWLLDQVGLYLTARAEFALARPLFERALTIEERVSGPDHPNTAAILHNLGGLFWDTGELGMAKPCLERALAISEKVFGLQHAETASSLTAMASLLHDLGDLETARSYHERALAIFEKVLGPDHPNTAQPLNNLAAVLRDQGDLEAARPLFERTLAIFEKVRGPDHPNTALALNNLAEVVREQGDLEAARQLFERALETKERVQGPDHPDTALVLNNLADVFRMQGDLETARQLSERALAIFEKVLGPDNSNTALVLNNLATVVHDLGDLETARALLERALAIWEKVLGPDNPNTALALNNLAAVLREQGDLETARPLLQRALAIFEKVLGPDHPNTALVLNNLADVFRRQGDLETARQLSERALAIFEKVQGPDHPNTALPLVNLAALLANQGQSDAAWSLVKRARNIQERALGSGRVSMIQLGRALDELDSVWNPPSKFDSE